MRTAISALALLLALCVASPAQTTQAPSSAPASTEDLQRRLDNLESNNRGQWAHLQRAGGFKVATSMLGVGAVLLLGLPLAPASIAVAPGFVWGLYEMIAAQTDKSDCPTVDGAPATCK